MVAICHDTTDGMAGNRRQLMVMRTSSLGPVRNLHNRHPAYSQEILGESILRQR